MPRRAAGFRLLRQAQKNVCAAGEAAQTQKEPSSAKSDPGVGRCRAGDPAYLTYPLQPMPEGFTVTHSRGIAPHSACPRQCRGRDRLPIFNLWLFTDNKISYYAGGCKVVGRKMWGKSCEALSAACGDSSPRGRAKRAFRGSLLSAKQPMSRGTWAARGEWVISSLRGIW